jgi:hypothetical protein
MAIGLGLWGDAPEKSAVVVGTLVSCGYVLADSLRFLLMNCQTQDRVISTYIEWWGKSLHFYKPF